ncbi:FkbM family methyltransferase [Roseomonas indoligenes]|uniref:FkbM family methyltransferase n=1 Tax=Roseomonas indoligenes TaxID=2820811 RepID=A0A940MVB5_9PROT|nr:FkbM family methyltransferase [Pararoseomonas indoligenes]MBP0491424.1 FkbM family methyltransferase [Pararoseomonas indoligenes]
MPRLRSLFPSLRRGPSAGEQAVMRRLAEMDNALTRRALAAEEKLERLSRRMEEITAYFAQRAHPLHHTQSNYLGDHTALTLLQGRHMLYVDTRGIDIAPHLMVHGIWETGYTALFERLVRPGATVLDVGANLGVYAILGGAKGARVHAFEPNPRLCELLRRSIAVNGFTERVTLHEAAVGDVEGEVQLAFDTDWPGGGHVVPPNSTVAGRPCRVAVPDRLFPDPGFRLDLVKMDVEGFEGHALRGMRDLLARSPEVRIMMEFAPGMMASQGMGPAETVALLSGLGFRFWNIGLDSGLTPVEADVLAAESGAGVRNILVARKAP